MRKGQVFFFGVKLYVLGYLSAALGYFALLGIFIGGDNLFASSAYRTEYLVYFLLGVVGLLGLTGLWISTLTRRWLHNKWLSNLTAALLGCGILTGLRLLYFYLAHGTVTWKATNYFTIGLIALPIVWVLYLFRSVKNAQSTSNSCQLVKI